MTHAENTSSPTYHSFYPWIAWGLPAAFFFMEYVARVSTSVMEEDMMSTFGINATEFGSLISAFYLTYLGMQIPVGALVDRYGAIRLLIINCLISTLGCAWFSSAPNLFIADIARLMIGFGGAFAFVGALKIATVWFPAERLGLLAGLTQVLGMLGGAVAGGPLVILLNHVGWRWTQMLIACSLCLIAILMLLLLREHPNQSVAHATQVTSAKQLWRGCLIVLKNPQTWYNAMYAGFIYMPTAAFAEGWGVSYLIHVNHISKSQAANAVSMIFIGWAIGGTLIGWISDKMKRRRPVMFISALASLATLTLVLYMPMHYSLVVTLLFLYGVFNTSLVTAYAVSGEINPRAVAGTSIALANMLSVVIGAAFQPIIGLLLDWQWHGELLNNTRVYTPKAYQLTMLSLPVGLILAFFMAFFVKETYCKRNEKEIILT